MTPHAALRAAALALIAPLVGLSAAEPPAPAATSPWGFASSAEWFGEYPRFDPLMADAGVRWLRAFPEWHTIQPAPGQWNWKPADDLVADARRNGIGISGGFWYFAEWATPTGDTRTCPLKDLGAWSAYVGAAVGRYRADIRDWEVYNEFNGSFANAVDKPRAYADLVVAARAAATRADAGSRIGIGCANFDLGFLDSAIKAGAGGAFDFVCVHPYENLGALVEGGEPGFLSMAASLRAMLADNRQRRDIGLRITEMGFQSTVAPDAARDAVQAEVLVKGHVLALAQGFERVCWFEARGPSYGAGTDHGAIRQDWSLRPCYHAWKRMTGLLGGTPEYVGWLDLAQGGYGFVFRGPAGPVLVAWSSGSTARSVSLTAAVAVTDLAGTVSPLPAGQPLPLGPSPVFVSAPPADLVALAQANAGKPFPWGGDYATAVDVAIRLGATNADQGITQRSPQTTDVVNGLDHSYRRSHHRDGEGRYAYFRVDPRFATFGDKALEITVVVRRAVAGQAVGLDVCYESLGGYRGTGTWWEVPAGEGWVEHTWTVADANFVGGWGWNLRTDIGGSVGDVAIREVRVRKLKPAAK